MDEPIEVFEPHEYDVPPKLMAQQIRASRLKVRNASAALDEAKKYLWQYEHSSFYSKSLLRARKQGYDI